MRIILGFLLLVVSFSALTEQGQPDAEPKDPKEMVWIDVRSWVENQVDSIEGDPHIPHDDIVADVTEQFPDKGTPIRLYCKTGGRAGKALDRLSKAGYIDVQNAGGIADVRKLRFTEFSDSAETALPVQ